MLCLTTAAVNAQQNQPAPAVFSNFSSTIQFSESLLSGAIQTAKGQQALLNFGSGFQFAGTIISNEQVFSNLKTVIVRSTAYNNALLQISQQVNEDKSISYVGRIFSPGSADGYELKKSPEGNYRLQKFETAKIFQDCNTL